MRWVRPALTVVCHSAALVSSVDARWTSAGTRSVATATVAARWIDVGNTSLDDCEALTWSLGWTFAPSLDSARVARTSLAFMFDEVPEPVWNTSIGNWSSWRPSATSAAAAAIASATARSSTPRSAFTIAAAALIWASARMCWRSRRVPEIGKLSTARWVWARHSASFGTWTSPIVSRSMRYSMAPILPRAAAAWHRALPASVPAGQRVIWHLGLGRPAGPGAQRCRVVRLLVGRHAGGLCADRPLVPLACQPDRHAGALAVVRGRRARRAGRIGGHRRGAGRPGDPDRKERAWRRAAGRPLAVGVAHAAAADRGRRRGARPGRTQPGSPTAGSPP